MWARISEFFFALWLAISFIIFHYDPKFPLLTNDLISFALIAFFSLGSYVAKLRRLYLMNFAMGIWLMIFSLQPFVPDGPRQNYISLGLLLLTFAVIPCHSEQAPYDWLIFMKNRKKHKK